MICPYAAFRAHSSANFEGGFAPLSVQNLTIQKLNPGDIALRLEHARAVLNIFEHNENILANLIMSDEPKAFTCAVS